MCITKASNQLMRRWTKTHPLIKKKTIKETLRLKCTHTHTHVGKEDSIAYMPEHAIET